jgi:hypothetical protein
MTLEQELDRADAARYSAWEAIVGPITIVDTRSQILLSYTSIALEHQEAIVLLARRGLSGSAFALVRPVFEILYRAAWICACAKPAEVDRIKAGKFTFPMMGDMVAEIDAKHGFDFFKGFKASSWNEQNDFTHTGKLQIGSRLTRDDLQAAYPDEMIAIQVATATIASMMVAVLLLKTHNRMLDGERLEQALAQFGTTNVDQSS